MKKLLLTLFAVLAFGVIAKAETVTFDFTSESTIKAMNSSVAMPAASAGTNVNDVPFTIDGINVTGTKGNSTEARIWGTTSPGVYQYRLYNGAKLTISSTSETINKIIVTGSNLGNMSAAGYSNGTWTGSANSVEFSLTGTININTIEVTYGEGGTVTPPVDPDPDPDVPTGPGGAVAFVAQGATYTGDATVVTLTAGEIPGKTFTADGICTFGMTKVNSSTSQVTGNQLRWYQGDVITITPLAGITITGITVTSVSGNSAENNITNTSDIGQWSYNGTTATWEGITTEPLKFASVKQIRSPYIVVTYVRDEGSKKDAGLSFSSNAVTVKGLSATGFEPTLSKETTATPSYTSSNTSVATVNDQGVVTLVNYGTTVITASVEETDAYAAGSISYTLTVEPDGILTVKEALDLIGNGYNGNAQVKGYISQIDELSISYGNATYWIVDEKGTESPALEIYRGYSLNGEKFTEEDEIEVGGLVTVEGTILNYNGTPEFTTGSKIVSYTPPTTVEPEPEYSVTFNFTGVQNAWYYVNVYDVDNGDVVDVDKSSMSFPNTTGAQFSISAKDGYSLTITCTTEGLVEGTDYIIMGNSANGILQYMVGRFKQGTDISFDVNVTQVATPEVTINFTGAYKDNLKFAVMGMQQDITSGSYTLDLSDIEDDDYPYVLSFQIPEGYTVEITGNMEESESTWQEMPIGQGANGVNVGIFGPGAAGLELTANVTAEAEEIPADAYVVYYNGEVASNINQYDWWNASWNAQAMNPDGVGMAFEFKAADGGAAASMGLAGATAEVVGKLHNATLNFDWYAVGTGSYKLQLTGGGKNYFYEINPADVPAGTDVAWNSVSIDIATQWPELAEAWNVNTAKDEYLFAVLLSDGTEGDAIYFNKIYYTNVDESWTAPEAPAPETVPAPEQPQDMMLSFITQYGQEAYTFGGWGQSTQAENTTIDGKPVIAMTNFNYLGLVDFDINISDYDYMHVDYWTPNENTPFGFVPISLNPTRDEPIWNAETVKANEWNSYDVALSFWENVDMTSIEQIKFVANQQGGTTPYGYIANVYFWKEAEPNVLTLNITGGENAWQHVSVYDAVDEEEVVLTENTYSLSNYGTGHLLTVSPKEGYEVNVTIGTEGLIENKDYQIMSQDVNDVVQYAIGMFKNDVDVIFNVAVTEAAPEGPDAIYVVGNGEGLTWDLPGTKYNVVNGVATFTVNNLQAFKASINNTTEWDNEGGFNAGCYGTGTNAFGDAVANTGGQTLKMELWGENQEVPWAGTYTITMNFNTMEMTAYTTTPKPVEAPDVYVRGDMNGWLNSGMQDAWKFTNVSWDATAQTGVFKLENVSIKAGQTFKIADSTWGSVNYGGVSGIMINELTELKYNDQTNLTLAQDFEGDVTFTITSAKSAANVIFEMEGPVKDPDQFYVIGTLAEGAWNPTVGVKMESNGNGKYTAEKVTLVESDGSTGFAITANLGTDSNDWTSVNALRFGPAQNDAMAVIGNNTDLAMGDLSWTFTPGTYTMVFDYTNKTLNIEEYVEPVLPDEIDVTFDFSSYDNIKEYAGLTGTLEDNFTLRGSNYYYIIKKLENGGIELTGDKGTYTGTLPYDAPYINMVNSGAKSMTFRMQVGNTFTISAPEGYTLKNVTFGGTSANYVSGPVLVAGEPGTTGAATGSSSNFTRTWTAPEEGTVNTITFTLPSGSCILKTINVVAEKVEEPALNTLVFEDWTMEVSKNQTTPETAEVPVSLDVDEPFAYQGFQFDIQLPAGLELVDPITLNAALNGSVSFSCINETNNVYRVIAHSDWAEDGYNLTEDLVTLTVATTYPSEDGLATLIASGDYDVTITNIDFSTALGDDMDDFEDFTGTVTIINAEVPATDITINSVTLNKPSYTTPSSNMVEEVVQGESVTINATLLPENTTDELTADADNGATVESIEFDEETGTWNIVVNTDEVEVETGQEVTVIITITAGDQEKTYELTVKGILLGDSNDNGVVTVADVVTTANYMVDSPVETFCFPNANVILTEVDGKQVINTQDITATIEIVLDNFDGNRNKQNIRRYANQVVNNDRLLVDNFVEGNQMISIMLDNSVEYTALTATIEIPEGMTVHNVVKGARAANHDISWTYKNGLVKFVLYSLENASFGKSEGSLIDLEVSVAQNCGDLNITDINASDRASNGYYPSFEGGRFESNATGIDGIDADNADVRFFTVDGLEVVNPEKGQILIKVSNGNAEKVIVK